MVQVFQLLYRRHHKAPSRVDWNRQVRPPSQRLQSCATRPHSPTSVRSPAEAVGATALASPGRLCRHCRRRVVSALNCVQVTKAITRQQIKPYIKVQIHHYYVEEMCLCWILSMQGNCKFVYFTTAGIVDKDAPLVDIAREEVLEECGYNVSVDALEQIIEFRLVYIDVSTYIKFVYVCKININQ